MFPVTFGKHDLLGLSVQNLTTKTKKKTKTTTKTNRKKTMTNQQQKSPRSRIKTRAVLRQSQAMRT